MAPTPSVRLVAHLPERRRRPTTNLACGCCCCCCCCLHTIGGIIGSAVAPTIGAGMSPNFYSYYVDEDDNVIPIISQPGISAVALFWRLVGLLMFVGVLISLVNGAEGLIIGIVIQLLVFPALQLLSAIITFLVIGLSQRPDKGVQLRQLGKVTLGLIVGTLSGVLAMFAIFFGLNGFKM